MDRSIINRANVLRSGILTALIVAGLGCAPACQAQPQPAPAKFVPNKAVITISLNSLSMEINALQALHQFQFDKEQLDRLENWAVETVLKNQTRKAGKASKEYRDKMSALRKALQDAKDGEAIVKLGDELDALSEKERPELDDRVEATPASRQRALEAYRLLRPSQLAFYLGRIADGIADPLEHLRAELEEVRALTEEEWKARRDDLAEDVSRAVAGLDSAKAKRVSDQVLALLSKARGLAKADFETQRADLAKAASAIIGDVSAERLLRNQVEFDLATLLANPRIIQACKARIKSGSEVKMQTAKTK